MKVSLNGNRYVLCDRMVCDIGYLKLLCETDNVKKDDKGMILDEDMNEFVFLKLYLYYHGMSRDIEMDVDKLFKWLLDDIIEHGKNIPKLLVFLQSKPQCTELYSTFKKALGSAMYFTPNGEPKDDRTSIIGMYHHGTGDDQKESALKSFTADDEYPMRILFCTSSFGLGVNVKNCLIKKKNSHLNK